MTLFHQDPDPGDAIHTYPTVLEVKSWLHLQLPEHLRTDLNPSSLKTKQKIFSHQLLTQKERKPYENYCYTEYVVAGCQMGNSPMGCQVRIEKPGAESAV